MRARGMLRGLVMKRIAFAVVIVLALLACEEGKSAFDLEVGDCIVPPESTSDEAIDVGRVGTVDCSEPHDGEVVSVFELSGFTYPGDDVLFNRAVEQCPQEISLVFYPSEESWSQGDREVACVLESLFDLQVGDCIRYPGPESVFESVERVRCSDLHDAKVVGSVEMAGVSFPGDDAIADYGFQHCPASTDQILGPTLESWELGDREITCLDE